ncbi:MAG: MotA/TolQ/ExbB proton channel family protein [Nitrospirae bacterium]|nr:MotA/TolQ/ExbB proton channel family protein [Candidatus Troglogloeales bacterium]MBI3598522.1 MotA/TolQ/ExbB proton channel family protein [Candidatus Troglogloeales bacterium]
MNSSIHFSILHSIASAGWIAQCVLAILTFCSVASWAIILYKVITLRKADLGNRRFLAVFLKSNNLQELKNKTIALGNEGPIAALFSNVSEKVVLGETQVKTRDALRNETFPIARLERILRSGIQDEMDYYERYIHFLATIGNTAPFIGLFGTVVGIVNSFRAIGLLEVANIAVVAPGISEALIATAAGLAAAIPAVVAYNLFANQLNRLEVKLEIFSSELITFIETSDLKSLPDSEGLQG